MFQEMEDQEQIRKSCCHSARKQLWKSVFFVCQVPAHWDFKGTAGRKGLTFSNNSFKQINLITNMQRFRLFLLFSITRRACAIQGIIVQVAAFGFTINFQEASSYVLLNGCSPTIWSCSDEQLTSEILYILKGMINNRMFTASFFRAFSSFTLAQFPEELWRMVAFIDYQ